MSQFEENHNCFKYNLLVAGVTRNGAKSLKADIKRLKNCLLKFNSTHYLVIESDSDDDTINVLQDLENTVKNFRYISLGQLKNEIPVRTERIAFCRNKYISEINSNPQYKNLDFVVVTDLDNVINLISEEAIVSCWENNLWDVCTANQDGPYYDIFALRHPLWSNTNHTEEFKFLKRMGLSDFSANHRALYSKMIKIPIHSDWIEVDSAFGGLAIYKKEVFKFMRYNGSDSNQNAICEHVPVSLNLTNLGYSIYINPRLINCSYTEHTRALKFLFFRRIYMDYLMKSFKKIRTFL